MRVDNVKIYDLKESILAAGYPMQTELKRDKDIEEQDLKRMCTLTNLSKHNPAHAQFLTGIRVNFDLTFSNKAWVEAERYRFLEFVSSQSTMHRITKFNVREQYNEYVDPRMIAIMEEKIADYNKLQAEIKEYEKTHMTILRTTDECKKLHMLKEQLKLKYLQILYSNPSGFELTARLTTNYRCLRNIYLQRHDHRLPEWREFCKWIETLPYAEELLINFEEN